MSVERRAQSDCFVAYSQTHPMRYRRRKVERALGALLCLLNSWDAVCRFPCAYIFKSQSPYYADSGSKALYISVCISTDILWAFSCWCNRPYYTVAFLLSGNQQTTQLETCFPIMLQSLNFCLMQSSNETRNFATNGLGIELPAKEDKG